MGSSKYNELMVPQKAYKMQQNTEMLSTNLFDSSQRANTIYWPLNQAVAQYLADQLVRSKMTNQLASLQQLACMPISLHDLAFSNFLA